MHGANVPGSDFALVSEPLNASRKDTFDLAIDGGSLVRVGVRRPSGHEDGADTAVAIAHEVDEPEMGELSLPERRIRNKSGALTTLRLRASRLVPMLSGMSPPRTLTIPVAGTSHRLEGRLRALSPEIPLAVVAPPHPVYGGTIGNPVVRAIEHAFEARGFSTLAFNFRGTGEDSTGEPSGEESDAKQDYLAAARSVPDTPLGWLSGYSFGSVAALAAAIELSLPRVLMVAPPLGLLDPQLLDLYRGQLIVVIGSEDEYAPLDAVRELLGPLASTQIEVLEGVEHFFHGSSAQRLSEALTGLLPARTERTCDVS